MLGQPLDHPERDKARAIVAGSGAIAHTVDVGRRYVDEAVAAAHALEDDALGSALAHLARSFIDEFSPR